RAWERRHPCRRVDHTPHAGRDAGAPRTAKNLRCAVSIIGLNDQAMNSKYSRREMLSLTGRAALLGSLGVPFCFAGQEKSSPRWKYGAVVGENTAMKVGERILAEGGNAVDAAVAAALTACIAAPARSGIGGHGGHMIIALAGGKKNTAI